MCMILSSFALTQDISAQEIARKENPRLVVGITVEGLSIDYLNLLKERFGNDGLGYVMNNGVTLTDVDFGTQLDGTAANAMIYTGAAPTINGIDQTEIFDITTRRVVPALNSQSPSAADENYSPSALLATTLTDELKIDGAGSAQVHSVAPDASMAITAAGHAANTAYWINNASGKWTTSSYYQDRPTFIQYRNRMRPVDAVLDTLVWKPSFNPSAFPFIATIQAEYPYRVFFPNSDPQRYRKYKLSPIVNDEITHIAAEYIKSLDLGKHEATDMLSLAYTLQPYPYGSGADEKMQAVDGYIRLDRNLENLFKEINNTVGMQNTLVFIVGTPVNSRSRRDDDKWRIPTGDFSVRKASSLLNLYLINRFGNGDWIAGYHNGYFYLNTSTIAEHQVDASQVRTTAAEFLRKMAGVAYAYPIDDIVGRRVHDRADAVARNTRADRTGDIAVTTAPGWKVVDSDSADSESNLTYRMGVSTSPAFILYPTLQEETITSPVDARAIAPTIASILHIRAPNGASLPPLRLKEKKL